MKHCTPLQLQMDWTPDANTQNPNLPTNRERYDISETTDVELLARSTFWYCAYIY